MSQQSQIPRVFTQSRRSCCWWNQFQRFVTVYAWALVYSAWLHNHFSVKRAMTSYKRKTGRFYSEKFGYLKTSLKRLPQWTKGMWLGKTMSNDFHMIGTPSGIFITRSIRKLPDYVDWEYGCSNLWIPKLPLRRAFTNLSHPLAPFRTQPE